ncbi:MAG: MFS transporter [Fimbriimonas sp.]
MSSLEFLRVPSFDRKLSWYLASLSYWFSNSFKWFVVLAVLPQKVNTLVPDGEKNGAWGLVIFVGALEAIVGPALCGALSDRLRSRGIGRVPFVVAGAILTAISLMALSAASSVALLTIAYLLVQISDDIATGPYSALIPELVPADHRGFAAGLRGALDQSARIVGAVVGFFFGKDLVAAMGIVAFVNMSCAILVAVSVREDLSAYLGKVQEKAAPWFETWKSADFRIVFFAQCLASLGFYVVYLYGQNFLVDAVGVPKGDGLKYFVVIAVVLSLTAAVSSVIAGKQADKIGRKKVLLAAGWLMFFTLLPFAVVTNYTVIVALAAIFGIGFGPFTSIIWALSADIIGESTEVAKDMGIWQAAIVVPQLFSGAMGTLIDSINRSTINLGYSVAFTLGAFFFLSGALLVRKIQGVS